MKKKELLLGMLIVFIVTTVFDCIKTNIKENDISKTEIIQETQQEPEQKPITGESTLSNHSMYSFYKDIAYNLDTVQIVDSENLTEEMLLNRSKDGTIIIERVIGIVLDSDLNGEIINTDDGYYINYSHIKDIKEGDIILSYFVYNPDTNYIDDILYRFDYVLDSTME